MTMTKLVVTTALLTSLTIGGASYAQTGNAANTNTPAAAAGKEAPKASAGTQLPADKAKLYNETMKQANEGNSALREQIQKTREEADALLIAEKFDKKAYIAKASELDQLYTRMRASMNEAFTSVAEKLSLEERKILLQNRSARQSQRQMQQRQ